MMLEDSVLRWQETDDLLILMHKILEDRIKNGTMQKRHLVFYKELKKINDDYRDGIIAYALSNGYKLVPVHYF